MGYLDNTTITLDAILTKLGRKKLANGESLNITQYAFADDEVDYTLWNESHPNGTDYYGSAIENMPLLEAVPDESKIMRFKLVTLPKNTAAMPLVSVSPTSITTLKYGQTATLVPSTLNGSNGTYGYTAIIHNSDAADIVGNGLITNVSPTVSNQWSNLDTGNSKSVVGLTFTIKAKSQPIANITTKITIIGNETGGSATVDLTVLKDTKVVAMQVQSLE